MGDDRKAAKTILAVSPPPFTTSIFDEVWIFIATFLNYVVFLLLVPLFLYLFISMIRWTINGEWLSVVIVVGLLGWYHYKGGNKPYHLRGDGRPW